MAERQLKAQSPAVWTSYLNEVLPGEIRLLEKLSEPKPQSHWPALAPHIFEKLGEIKDKNTLDLIAASLHKDAQKAAAAARKLIADYYLKNERK